MSDKELVLEVLHQTAEAVGKVLRRFAPVNSVAYLTDTPEGMEKLDAICMLLIAIGESLKHIDNITDRSLLSNYPEIDWKGAKGLRDILSHHYFDIDPEQIFWVCTNRMRPLGETLEKIIADLEQGSNER